MLIAVHPEQHIHVARSLSQAGLDLIHQTWPETAPLRRTPYLLNIPEEHGRSVGEQMSQEDFEILASMWPELNWFLEQPLTAELAEAMKEQDGNR